MPSSGAALVVHDLKNALGALEARLGALALQPDAAAAAAAHRDCQALRQRLVMYLTVYGQVDAATPGARLRAHCDDESPAELLRTLAQRHATAAAPGAVQVVVADGAPEYWHLDRRLVLMALEAALHNALRFARRRVTLGAHVEGTELVFRIDDDGPGLEHGQPADGHATGLGTTLCRAVALAHGHTGDDAVRLQTRPEGGARFELRLAT